MSIGSELNSLCDSANEESGPLVNNAPLTGYETKFFDDYHFSETTEIFIQESSTDSRPSNLHDSEISDDTIGRALSSPLFTQEREEPGRQAHHSPEESLLPAQSFFFAHTSTGRPVYELRSSQERKSSREMVNERTRILLERQKKRKFSLKSEPRSISTNFKPILIEEVSRNRMELLSLSEVRLIIPSQRMHNFDEINYWFKKNHQNEIGIFVKLIRSHHEMEELERVQGSRFVEF